jgi:hypothetical protein
VSWGYPAYASVLVDTDTAAPRYIRVTTEVVVEIDDAEQLREAALASIAGNDDLTDTQRVMLAMAVGQDLAHAVAELLDPGDLVAELPGVFERESTWSAENLTGYEPPADADEADDADAAEIGVVAQIART